MKWLTSQSNEVPLGRFIQMRRYRTLALNDVRQHPIMLHGSVTTSLKGKDSIYLFQKFWGPAQV